MTTHDELAALDKRHLWHPFTHMRDWLADDPLIIERAEGNYLYDTRGARYFDGVSSLWVNVHGHHRPEIDSAIRAQLDRVAHSTLLGLSGVPAIELASRLVPLAPPGLTRVFYSDSGSTAVEVALKIAYQYWHLRGQPGKRRFVTLAESYHGDTIGSVSLGGIDLFHQIFHHLLFHALRVPTPHPYGFTPGATSEACRDHALQALEHTLAEHHQELAAFVLEPIVQGAAGMLVHPPGYLAEAARLCRKHDVLLICDEVATGFGRTGTLFACEHEQVRPDILCLAKGLTGGYLPLAATLTTETIFDAFVGSHTENKTFFHGHSYTGNALGCAAALASLDIFTRDQVIPRLQPKIRRLAERLAAEIAPLAHAGDVRQRGFMVGIELVADRRTRATYPAADAIGAKVCRAVRRARILLRPLGPVVVLMPPLSTTEAELDHLVSATAAAIREVTEPA